jgi:hypothetical protein
MSASLTTSSRREDQPTGTTATATDHFFALLGVIEEFDVIEFLLFWFLDPTP